MMGRRTVGGLIVLWLALTGCLVWAERSHANEAQCSGSNFVSCDDFEARSTSQPSAQLSGSDTKLPTCTRSQVGSSTSGITIIDAGTVPQGVHNGSRAMQLAYPAGNDGTDYMDCTLSTGNLIEIYWRWYVKYSSNFQWSGVATKHNELLLSGGAVGDTPQLAWTGDINSCGTNPTSPMKPTIFLYNSSIFALEYCGFPRNVSDVPTIGFDTWYCVEAHVKANTSAGANNGQIELWLDGVQILNHTGFDTFVNGTSRINGLFVSGYWNNSQSHGLMYRWEDDHVASTSRVGCLAGGGSTPPNTIMFITQTGLVIISTLLQALFIGGWFWQQRTVAVQTAVKFWRYASEMPTPKEVFWAYRYRKAVKKWQQSAPLMIEHQPPVVLELPKEQVKQERPWH